MHKWKPKTKREVIDAIREDVGVVLDRIHHRAGYAETVRDVRLIDTPTFKCAYCGVDLSGKHIYCQVDLLGDVHLCLDRMACREKWNAKTDEAVEAILAELGEE